MGAPGLRPRVYVHFRYGGSLMARVLDLAYLDGEPIAVLTWVVRDGKRAPGDYVQLDATQLRPSLPPGTFWYDVSIDYSKDRAV
jgi:hypothetical protein